MSIQKPKMILFDYGHTLLYEIGHNAEKGNKAIYQYIKSNPKNISFQEFNKIVNSTFKKINEMCIRDRSICSLKKTELQLSEK